MKRGDVTCDREHQGNYILSLPGNDVKINANTAYRWRKVREVF